MIHHQYKIASTQNMRKRVALNSQMYFFINFLFTFMTTNSILAQLHGKNLAMYIRILSIIKCQEEIYLSVVFFSWFYDPVSQSTSNVPLHSIPRTGYMPSFTLQGHFYRSTPRSPFPFFWEGSQLCAHVEH